jgi:hypothetical protein
MMFDERKEARRLRYELEEAGDRAAAAAAAAELEEAVGQVDFDQAELRRVRGELVELREVLVDILDSSGADWLNDDLVERAQKLCA